MASPFPGMDPYLEQYWRDVHASLVIYARDYLQGGLPGDLRARVEERVVVEPFDRPRRHVYPDVRVVQRGRPRGEGAVAVATAPGVALAEPLVIQVQSEPLTETFIEIIDTASGKQVVTVIEILSLANKLPGQSRKDYRQKRWELLRGGVSLVEIDLLRTGGRELSISTDIIPPTHRTLYQICVRRGWEPTAVEVYPVPLRERLPIIRVPLRKTDPDAPLDLQTLLDQCYLNGGYDDDIDYCRPPVPRLGRDDAPWADELLRAEGRRA